MRCRGSAHPLGVPRRGHAGESRLLAVPGQVPVLGEYRGIDVEPCGQEPGDAPVQPSAVPWRDVVVHRLPQQVVAEPVSRSVDHHEIRLAGPHQGVRDGLRVHADRLRHHELVALVGHRDDLEDRGHVAPLLFDPGEEHAAQVIGDPQPFSGKDLLHEKGDPSCPSVQGVRLLRRRSSPGDAGGELSDLRRGERLEIHPGDGHPTPDRVGERAQLAGRHRTFVPVRPDHAPTADVGLGDEVGEGVAGRPVGPVQVLGDHHQGTTARQPRECRPQALEQLRAADGTPRGEHPHDRCRGWKRISQG